ncbi:acyl-CoA dehydrogenase, partial [Aquabacterium sp.]|uniref:acyl-CoA dehydrogenase n=1 Tax=Aquabacterium sp. TaxID=1872578 RepID=UPI0035AF2F23
MSTLRADLDFLLFEWLHADDLTRRERYAEHSRETFGSVLDTAEKLAADKFAPFNRLVDVHEPEFDGERVHMPAETQAALQAFAEAGFLAGSQSEELGGMNLPAVVELAAATYFSKASIGMSGYGMLTKGNAGTLLAHGSPAQVEAFAKPEFAGRFSGTMCLSEPQAGSSLSDITTRATPDGADFAADPLGPRYRLKGNKMWISGGEHDLTENIVHLVLAKIPGDDGQLVPGVKGISLFVVPKKLVHPDGRLTGERNDVSLAGLNHKCGFRGTVNTLLNFGEGRYPVRGSAGAIGYLVGEAGKGLQAMFHMMNEARIGVGIGATMLGYAGYEASLDYARQRPQGRRFAAAGEKPAKDAATPQVPIIEHADVRRMLLAQKAIVEGGLALGLYCAYLLDEQRTGSAEAAADASLLLEMLTPIVKSWPSEWALEANSLAIQVLGGYGYTRDFPVEQYWRDNRLNMIHEGTHGIQGMDLLGRKVIMQGGKGLQLLGLRIQASIARAGQIEGLREFAQALGAALGRVAAATQAAWATPEPARALANATPYLQAFGHTVLAWIWLEQAV